MSADNPYASPASDLAAKGLPVHGKTTGFWRSGNLLIVPRKAVLPELCARCGTSTHYFKKTQKIELLMKKPVFKNFKCSVTYHLCERHYAQRRNLTVAAWIAVIVGVAVWPISLFLDARGVTWAIALPFFGTLLLVCGLYLFIFKTRVIYPRAIDDSRIWISGLNEVFYAHVPDFNSVESQAQVVGARDLGHGGIT